MPEKSGGFCDAATALGDERRAIGGFPSFFLLKDVPLLFLTWNNSFTTIKEYMLLLQVHSFSKVKRH